MASRNGRTGHLLRMTGETRDIIPPHQEACRIHRAKLQNALLRGINRVNIRVGKKLTKVSRLPSGKLSIAFQDGQVDEVDLLIGADGLRSVSPSNSPSRSSHVEYKAAGRQTIHSPILQHEIHRLNILPHPRPIHRRQPHQRPTPRSHLLARHQRKINLHLSPSRQRLGNNLLRQRTPHRTRSTRILGQTRGCPALSLPIS